MNEIAKNKYYELSYDDAKNWIYWTMRGFWAGMSVAPNFEKDWHKAQKLAKKPFKIFADLSKLKVMRDEVKEANDKMQQELMQNGCIKVSCLIESELTKLSLNRTLKNSGMDKIVQYFDDAAEAEIWLDKD